MLKSFLYALIAVLIWAFTPVLVKSSHMDHNSLFIISEIIAIITSTVFIILKYSIMKPILRNKIIIVNSIICGIFLGLWYSFYYMALQRTNDPSAVSVIAFTWPLIALFTVHYLLPHTKNINIKAVMFSLLAFLGAVLVILNEGLSGNGNIVPLIYAFIAALGSGLYLPFAITALKECEKYNINNITSGIAVISIANTASLLCVILFGGRVNSSNINTHALLFSALIGIGVYLGAEVLWTLSQNSNYAHKFSGLPYFTPVLSIIFLTVFNNAPIKSVTIIGCVLVILSNILVHRVSD